MMGAAILMTLLLLAAGSSYSTLMAEDPSHADAARKLGGEASPLTDTYVSTYEIVATFEHDPKSFTQGLAFSDAGTLYESGGLYHQSNVRSVEVKPDGTTKSTKTVALAGNEFAEGIAIHGNKLLQLTWKERVRAAARCQPPSRAPRTPPSGARAALLLRSRSAGPALTVARLRRAASSGDARVQAHSDRAGRQAAGSRRG